MKWVNRSSSLQMFFKIGVLKNLAILTKKTPVLESVFTKNEREKKRLKKLDQ